MAGPNDYACCIVSLKPSSWSSLNRFGVGDSSSGKEIFLRPPSPGPLENAGVYAIWAGLVKELLLVLSICKKFALPLLPLLARAESKPNFSSAYSSSLKEASLPSSSPLSSKIYIGLALELALEAPPEAASFVWRLLPWLT